MFLYQFRLLH